MILRIFLAGAADFSFHFFGYVFGGDWFGKVLVIGNFDFRQNLNVVNVAFNRIVREKRVFFTKPVFVSSADKEWQNVCI